MQEKYLILCLIFIFNLTNAQSIKISSFGYNENDNASYIKQALESQYDTLIFDNIGQQWITSPLKLENINNKVILFENNVSLKAKPKAYKNLGDVLLEFKNCTNIEITGNNTKISMNKLEYKEGEWRHAISLRNSKNFVLSNLQIEESGGDGIYIAGFKQGTYSENIHILNCSFINNKRQGMSIISGKNIFVEKCIFTETKGTLPGAGLDIEPNSKYDLINNIKFENCVFTKNDHSGISLSLSNLTGISNPISILFENCVISNNHNEQNKYPPAEIKINANSKNPVKGSVIFRNCTIKDSKWGLLYSRKTNDAFNVNFIECYISNICQKTESSAITLEVPNYREMSKPLGGFHFKNVTIEGNSKSSIFKIYGSKLGTLPSVQNISGDITLLNPPKRIFSYSNYNPQNNKDFLLKFNIK